MPERLINLLIKYAWNHSIEAYYCDRIGKVIALIPIANMPLVMMEPAETLSQLREILGY